MAPLRRRLRPNRLRTSVSFLVSLLLTLFAGSAGLIPDAQAVTLSRVDNNPAATGAPVPKAAAAGTPSGSATALPVSEPRSQQSAHPAVSLDSITPNVPQQGSTVEIRGTFTNGGSALHGATVGLRVGGRPLSGRSAIALVAGGHSPAGAEGGLLAKPTAALPDLAPGQSAGFTMSVAANSLPLHGNGVYELSVEVYTGTAPNTSRTAITRTFLPWFPTSSGVQATRIATLWPLADTPRVQAQTYSLSGNDQQVPVLTNDGLNQELSPNGRLDQLVSIGSGLQSSKIPVTWVVDPDLLDTAHTMTTGYRVANGDDSQGARVDNTSQGSGGPAASSWLTATRNAVQGQDVVALPYADPDLASIAHNGSGSRALSGELQKSATAGAFTVNGRLQVTSDSTVAWPYAGYVDSSIVRTARAAGDHSVIVNGDSMPEPDSLDYTPSAGRSIGGGMTAVVADPAISNIFSGDLSTPGAQTLAEQRFLAETLMVTLELPSTQRNLLVAPPRDLSAGGARALAGALQYAVQGKWAQGASLKTVTSAPASPNVTHTVPPASDYPAKERAGELSGTTLSQTTGVQSSLDVLEKILTLKYRVINPFSTAIARSLSTSWRSDTNGGDAYRTSMRNYSGNLLTAVKLLPKSAVTLTGTTGTIPVTVQNDLQQPVVGLRLVLSSSNWLRLNVGPAQNVTVDGGGRNKTIQFKAGAKANNSVDVTAQLYTTADNRPFGQPITFQVNVTSVTGGVVWVVAVGLLLVLLAGLRFYGQRKKRAALAAEDPPEDGDSGADDADGGNDPDGADHDPRIETESRG